MYTVYIFLYFICIDTSCPGGSCQQTGIDGATHPPSPFAWHPREHLQLGQTQATPLPGWMSHRASDTLQQPHTDPGILKMDPAHPVAAAAAPATYFH